MIVGVYAVEPYRDQRTILSFYYLDSWNLSSVSQKPMSLFCWETMNGMPLPQALAESEWITGDLQIGPLTMNALVRISNCHRLLEP